MCKFWQHFFRVTLSGILLCLLLCGQLNSVQAAQRRVVVSNIYEFVHAIDDNTIIELQPGRYRPSDLPQMDSQIGLLAPTGGDFQTKGVYAENDGLTISGYTNLSIVAAPNTKERTEFISYKYWQTVLIFQNCKNITLDNLTVGHELQQGSCTGAVLGFSDCVNVTLKQMDLYGCGTYGYEARGCKNITMQGGVIRECSMGLAYAYYCSDLKFSGVTFKDTKKPYRLFDFNHSTATFENCAFSNVSGDLSRLQLIKATQLT